jgi:hypothetical protein
LLTQANLDDAVAPISALLVSIATGSMVAQLERALKMSIGVLAPEHVVQIRARLGLSILFEQAGRHHHAAEHLASALSAMSVHLDPAWPEQAEWWIRLGRTRLAERSAGQEDGMSASTLADAHKAAVGAFGKAYAAARVFGGMEHPFTVAVKEEMDAAVKLGSK